MTNKIQSFDEYMADLMEYPVALAERATLEELKSWYLESVKERFEWELEAERIESEKAVLEEIIDRHPRALNEYLDRLMLEEETQGALTEA